MNHNFGEKKSENIKGVECPVWQTPKYAISRDKAIEMIESGKYGLADGDFWILMNTYANGKKVMYTGLILSHNGCLKINDRLDSKDKFYAKNLTRTEVSDGLIYEYNDGELYEVGEVSKTNCKNDYPNAMAFKRCFDRVVLKKSKLAFYGVYSEVEADEFKQTEEVREFANEEVTANTYLSFMDDFIFTFPQYKNSIFTQYGLKQIEDIKNLQLETIDEIITKAKNIINQAKGEDKIITLMATANNIIGGAK